MFMFWEDGENMLWEIMQLLGCMCGSLKLFLVLHWLITPWCIVWIGRLDMLWHYLCSGSSWIYMVFIDRFYTWSLVAVYRLHMFLTWVYWCIDTLEVWMVGCISMCCGCYFQSCGFFLQDSSLAEPLSSLGFDACAMGWCIFALACSFSSIDGMLEDERSSCLRWWSLCSYCRLEHESMLQIHVVSWTAMMIYIMHWSLMQCIQQVGECWGMVLYTIA